MVGYTGRMASRSTCNPADGMQDLDFTAAIIDELSEQYCIDPDQVYATVHSLGWLRYDSSRILVSWVTGFRAISPVAANRPYWFEPSNGASLECTVAKPPCGRCSAATKRTSPVRLIRVNMGTNVEIFGWKKMAAMGLRVTPI